MNFWPINLGWLNSCYIRPRTFVFVSCSQLNSRCFVLPQVNDTLTKCVWARNRKKTSVNSELGKRWCVQATLATEHKIGSLQRNFFSEIFSVELFLLFLLFCTLIWRIFYVKVTYETAFNHQSSSSFKVTSETNFSTVKVGDYCDLWKKTSFI